MKPSRVILEMFYRADGGFVTPGELARRLKLPARRVGSEIAELQALGYSIETHPHHGYRLVQSPDRLTADDIKARRETVGRIGSEILVFDETGSTNDVVAQLARSGAREGLVVFAESQTKGRGRHGRAWASPKGKGLWFSVLLRPTLPASSAQRLTVAASVAVARAMRRASGVDARIRWPNDVTVSGRKLAGILTELTTADQASCPKDDRSSERNDLRGLVAVLGIGMDVNCVRADFPREIAGIATSLEIETGSARDRTALAAVVLDELDNAYRAALSDFGMIVDEWAGLSTTLGKHIVVAMGRRRIEGYAQALDSDGALLLRKDNGHIERIIGGDLVKEQT